MDQDPYPKPTDVEELRKRIHVMQFIKIANSVIESEGIERSKNYLEIPGEYKGVVLRDPRREDFIMRLDVGLVEGDRG